jgi:hypothetical protein
LGNKSEKVKVGDWVRFYRNGELVLGVVQYVKPGRLSYSAREVCTDTGAVAEDVILEVRRAGE